ncbi:MAG: universal stress protein, partial [Hyphococcus sp.]
MKSILVATDFSKRSNAAVARGAALAKALGAQLAVAHIVDDDQSERLAAAAETEAGALFEALSARLERDHGVAPSIIVTRGEPHAEILNAAEQAGADLIVVGAHRRNLVRNTFVGTTAERSIRASGVPVLVARAPDGPAYQHPLIALDLNEGDLFPLEVSAALGIFDAARARVVFAYDLYG